MTVISVIVGSTREGRFSEKPAKWILQHLKKRDGVDARLLDLRDFPMPFFDEPVPPAMPGRPLTRTRSCRDGPPRSRSPMASSSSPLTVEGPFLDKGDSVLAITGGPGEYAGAQGKMALSDVSGGKGEKYSFTYGIK
jgi:NADPH-dependent FMN reductase